jgi:hypothetical protein
MASEPNNANAEEQLKQYAAQRRQHVPALHQATRNLLQGEVRRVYGSSDQERRSRLRLRWFQALAWLVILAAIPLFLMPRNPSPRLQEAVPTQQNEVTLPSASAPGEAPIVLSDTKEPVRPPATEPSAPAAASLSVSGGAMKSKDAPEILRQETAAASAPTPAPRDLPKSAPMEMMRSANLERERVAAQDASKKAEVAEAVAKPQSPIATNLTMNFANTIPNQQVLSNFRIEQTGARLKIVENDGSVYPGRVLSGQAGNYAFQAAGMNRTLNKATIITGQVVRADANVLGRQQQATANNSQNTAAAQNTRNFYANNATSNAASNNSNVANNNSEEVRVQGAAIIGNTQYKLDAQPTPGQ